MTHWSGLGLPAAAGHVDAAHGPWTGPRLRCPSGSAALQTMLLHSAVHQSLCEDDALGNEKRHDL